MEILLWVVAWLLVGCGVAWMIGSAASMSDDVTGGKHSSQYDADANVEHFWVSERAPDDAANESAAIGTDRRRLRSI